MSESRHTAETESEDYKNEHVPVVGISPDHFSNQVDTAEVIAGFHPDELDDHCDALTREADEINLLDWHPDCYYDDIDNY